MAAENNQNNQKEIVNFFLINYKENLKIMCSGLVNGEQ